MVPMVRGDRTLGLIAVTRAEPTQSPDQLVDLLRTFAAQAVIAIENTRLFEAELASKCKLQKSLQCQTATAEVLSVISRSQICCSRCSMPLRLLRRGSAWQTMLISVYCAMALTTSPQATMMIPRRCSASRP